MQKQVLRVAGKRNWPLHDQETTDLYVVDCLDIQSGFSIAPAAQYCSVVHERVKLPIIQKGMAPEFKNHNYYSIDEHTANHTGFKTEYALLIC